MEIISSAIPKFAYQIVWLRYDADLVSVNRAVEMTMRNQSITLIYVWPHHSLVSSSLGKFYKLLRGPYSIPHG